MIPSLPSKESGFWTDPSIFEKTAGTILDCIHRGIQGTKEDKIKLMLVYRMYLDPEQFTQLILLYFRHIAGNKQLEELWVEFVELWILNCFHCDFNRPVRSIISIALNSLKEYQPEARTKLTRIVKYQKMLLAAVAKEYKRTETNLNFHDWIHDAAKSPTLVLEKAFKNLSTFELVSEEDDDEDDKRNSFSSRLSSYFKRLSVLPTINNSDLQDVEWILTYSSELIADHLYVADHFFFTKIPFTNLLNAPVAIQPYKKSKSDDESNLGALVDRFNRICQIVSTAIFTTKSSKIVRKFIHIAYHCYKLNNSSSLMAIVLGLQSPELDSLNLFSRLAKEDLDTFLMLKTICSPLGNFKQLRELSDKILVEKTAIPFVGLYISDIVFMKEIDSYLNDQICDIGAHYGIVAINLRKFGILSDRIYEFYKFQEKPCIDIVIEDQLMDICHKL